MTNAQSEVWMPVSSRDGDGGVIVAVFVAFVFDALVAAMFVLAFWV